MPKRAANNMGTVRKRSDGRWEGRYTASDGKQHSVYAKTAAACTEALRAAQNDVANGAWVEPSKLTVSEWMEIWLKDYQAHTSKRTVKKYESIIKHFNKSIGDVKAMKVTSVHVRRMVSALQSDDLTAASVQMYMRVFKTAMNCAVEAGIIKQNPANKLKLPKAQPRKLCIVDREQIPSFIDAARQTRYENELVFMLLTGLRIGEVRGLRWSDIDFDAATVSVERQLQPTHKDMERFTLPKYNEVRFLHVAPEVIALLKAQKKKQAEQRLAKGGWVDDDITTGLVFRQENGKAHTRGTISRAVTKAGESIGLPELHPHDLRHSYAIAALRSGASVKTVQYNLGHKTAKMTLDVYAAYTEDTGKTDATKLSAYLQEINN